MVTKISDLGKYLKGLREEKGLSLQDISQVTKIKVKFLQDIENNNYKNLGGLGYAKAMSFSYARIVEGDIEAIVKYFNERFPESVLPDFNKDPETMPKRYFFPTSIIPIIIIVIFAIIFTVVIIKSKSKNIPLKPKINTEKILKKEKPTQKINTEVLKDTTDYLNKYLFKKKKNPFKTDQ